MCGLSCEALIRTCYILKVKEKLYLGEIPGINEEKENISSRLNFSKKKKQSQMY